MLSISLQMRDCSASGGTEIVPATGIMGQPPARNVKAASKCRRLSDVLGVDFGFDMGRSELRLLALEGCPQNRGKFRILGNDLCKEDAHGISVNAIGDQRGELPIMRSMSLRNPSKTSLGSGL